MLKFMCAKTRQIKHCISRMSGPNPSNVSQGRHLGKFVPSFSGRLRSNSTYRSIDLSIYPTLICPSMHRNPSLFQARDVHLSKCSRTLVSVWLGNELHATVQSVPNVAPYMSATVRSGNAARGWKSKNRTVLFQV